MPLTAIWSVRMGVAERVRMHPVRMLQRSLWSRRAAPVDDEEAEVPKRTSLDRGGADDHVHRRP